MTSTTTTTPGTNTSSRTQVHTRIMYSQVIGTAGTFELDNDIKVYLYRFKNFFEANSITDEIKKGNITIVYIGRCIKIYIACVFQAIRRIVHFKRY